MKATRHAAHQDWEFDGKTITVHISMAWKRHGGRKVIIAPDGGDAWAPAKPKPDETLIRALARVHRWKGLLEEHGYRSAGELAEAEGVTRSFVNRLLRITLFAPDIREAILDGRQPKGLQLDDLIRPLPSDWEEQRKRLLPPGAAWAPGTAAQIANSRLAGVCNADVGSVCDRRKSGTERHTAQQRNPGHLLTTKAHQARRGAVRCSVGPRSFIPASSP